MPFRNSKSVISTLKQVDYSQWQRENVSPKPTFKSSLPPVTLSEFKKEEDKKFPQKSKDRKSESGMGFGFSLKMTESKRPKPSWQQTTTKEMMAAKSLENVKILQRISKSRSISLEELKRHSSVLLEKNKGLVKQITDMDADTAKSARDLLQQYDMFGTVLSTLRDSSQNQVGVAKAELQATEKLVEKNIGKLDLEMKRMNTKVHALQEELNVLRTYMDKEYPVKAVQIASLLRSIRSLSEEQQDELEDVEDLSRRFLDTLARKVWEEQECILQDLAEKKLMQYQDGLEQMHKNNRELKRQIETQKEIIDELVEEIQDLHRSIIKLHHSVGDPREAIFPDVLLRRPKCTPDMEIVLNIPTDEDFPL
ncbi:uncharacterized protein C20orf96 homolog [Varanus komodoensis]|uniref:uncharacterized protein C20orf96 homolog n=1 Tax=Varanus komodoensis TaxID=61221 RepID=UPI001CF78FAA|nr:uncharacterized protein C20orf96 homolog [Varanus komodoensis]